MYRAGYNTSKGWDGGSHCGIKTTGTPFITTDSDLVKTLEQALLSPHDFKISSCPTTLNTNPDSQYFAVFDTTTRGHTKYIGAYDYRNNVIIVYGGSQKINTFFVTKGFYTGKIEYGEISNFSFRNLDEVKESLHTYNFLTDDKDGNEIFMRTLGKHLFRAANGFPYSCEFTYNL